MDHQSGGNWFIRSPKHHKGNESVAKHRTLLLIILNLGSESDIQEVHDNLSNPNPLFEKKVRGQKQYPHALIISYQVNNDSMWSGDVVRGASDRRPPPTPTPTLNPTPNPNPNTNPNPNPPPPTPQIYVPIPLPVFNGPDKRARTKGVGSM